MTREKLRDWLDSPQVRYAIIAVIVVNAITLGLETSDRMMDVMGPLLVAIDTVCLTIFVAELVLKLYAHGWNFFKHGWNIFDFVIVTIALVPGGEGLSVLRAMRILRVLRAISIIPSLKRVIEGLIAALPGMGSVFIMMSLIFYIGAVMATKMFGDTFPEWFGTIGASAYSLFQIMTLESWSMGIVRPVMEVHHWAWAFFVPFIMITTFAVVNLLVGLIVNSMQEAHSDAESAKADAYREEVLTRLAAIEARMNGTDKPS